MSSSNSIVALEHGLIGPFADPRSTGRLRPRVDVSPDLLGFGAYADVGAEGITIDAQVEALRIDTEGAAPNAWIHLVEHSVGGVIAAAFAHRYLDRVASLVR